MTDQTLAHLESLGLTLPTVPVPIAAYVNCVRTGNLLFLSGGLPIDGDRKVIGKIPTDVTIEQGYEASRMVILNRLAVIRDEIGSLDRVKRIVTLNGFVNSTTVTTEQTLVSLKSAIKSFVTGGMTIRIACGKMIRRTAMDLDMPSASAASIWPRGIACKPAR